MHNDTLGGLVSSRNVTGTEVYSSIDGRHVGEIDYLLIDKTSGHVAYADMAFGGFLGMDKKHHLIPWRKLSYSKEVDGFVTDVTKEQLEKAPMLDEQRVDDRDWEKKVYDHYSVPYYWI